MSDLAEQQHPQTLMEVLAEPDDGKEPCPDCGKRYVPGPGMGVHRHSAHGNSSKRKRNDAGANRERKPALPPVTCDDVFDAVVSQLYPRGVIPVAALTPLLRWRHATDEMLEAIR